MHSTDRSTATDLPSLANRILGGPMRPPLDLLSLDTLPPTRLAPREVPALTKTDLDVTDTPMDAAVRTLRLLMPGRSAIWYRTEVAVIVHYNRPERSPIERRVIEAWTRREQQIVAEVE